ncbi:MAG TPA: VWA domain-containing protein [Pyrinomonadaceae bacterium]|nr:VWA domain-containing protein [Pyrinomonadaceae bacterium]
MHKALTIALTVLVFCIATGTASSQSHTRPVKVAPGALIEVINHFGKVDAVTAEKQDPVADNEIAGASSPLLITLNSPFAISEKDVHITSTPWNVRIEVRPADKRTRIDVSLAMPPKMKLKIETGTGEVRFSGSITSADVRTGTGTIAADIPDDNVRYSLLWTFSRPRFLSDFELKPVKEKTAGKFEITGFYAAGDKDAGDAEPADPDSEHATVSVAPNGKVKAYDGSKKDPPEKNSNQPAGNPIALNLVTERGIILINIPPNEVSSDLRERPLTNAAKAIIRSGDSQLMEAIRRAAPKYFGDYLRTLPPLKTQPAFADKIQTDKIAASLFKIASVRVSDVNNRAIDELSVEDFEVLESGVERKIVSVKRSTAPFNLVLLLDVSGSVDNYVNFIRKAARNFVNTVDVRDRISIVTFNDDVKVISSFTTDKGRLSESLDTFDAGGATAYYDALAFTLADTLRPLRGERTAIVILTDGDDNRSFLSFDSMLASIQESGALVYPLYVPSALVAAEAAPNPDAAIDSLRARYLQGELTSKAKGEGEKLAKVSGGVYYPITQLSQIQTAYEDIVRQLRTAYDIEYHSELGGTDAGVSPRLKVRSKRPNSLVQIRSVQPVAIRGR